MHVALLSLTFILHWTVTILDCDIINCDFTLPVACFDENLTNIKKDISEEIITVEPTKNGM